MEMNTNEKVIQSMQLPDVENPDKNNPDYWAPPTIKDDRIRWLETFISNIPSKMDEVIGSITTRLEMDKTDKTDKTNPSTVLAFQNELKIRMNRMIETSIPKVQGSVTEEFVDEMTKIINNSIKNCSDSWFQSLPQLSDTVSPPKTSKLQQPPSLLPNHPTPSPPSPQLLLPKSATMPPQLPKLPPSSPKLQQASQTPLPLCTTSSTSSTIFFVALMFLSFL